MDWLDDDLAAQSVEDRLAYFKKHLGDEISTYEAEEDRITIVADTDGDGRADKDWVFADGFTSAPRWDRRRSARPRWCGVLHVYPKAVENL